MLPFLFSVPPKAPSIFDESGDESRNSVGPYRVGETIVLKCISSGGKITKIHFNLMRFSCKALVSFVGPLIQESLQREETFLMQIFICPEGIE